MLEDINHFGGLFLDFKACWWCSRVVDRTKNKDHTLTATTREFYEPLGGGVTKRVLKVQILGALRTKVCILGYLVSSLSENNLIPRRVNSSLHIIHPMGNTVIIAMSYEGPATNEFDWTYRLSPPAVRDPGFPERGAPETSHLIDVILITCRSPARRG